MLIKSVFNKNQNHHYYNAFVEECLYQWAKCNDSKIFDSMICGDLVTQNQ